MKLEKVKSIVDQINGAKIDSFSALVAQLERIPGAKAIDPAKNEGLMVILATLFDAGVSETGAITRPQSITLEVKYPRGYCEEFDYEIGFRLGDKWAQLAHGWFSDVVRGINARTKPKFRDMVIMTMLTRSTVPPVS